MRNLTEAESKQVIELFRRAHPEANLAEFCKTLGNVMIDDDETPPSPEKLAKIEENQPSQDVGKSHDWKKKRAAGFFFDPQKMKDSEVVTFPDGTKYSKDKKGRLLRV